MTRATANFTVYLNDNLYGEGETREEAIQDALDALALDDIADVSADDLEVSDDRPWPYSDADWRTWCESGIEIAWSYSHLEKSIYWRLNDGDDDWTVTALQSTHVAFDAGYARTAQDIFCSVNDWLDSQGS